MPDNRKSAKEEFSMLGRGIRRTFFLDVIAAGIGALVGGILSYLFLDIYGNSFRLGALVGAIVGVMLRSLTKPLFDYDKRPDKGDDDKG